MGGTQVPRDRIDQVVRFHGHMCPGLAIGIRAAEVALREIGPHAEDEEVVAVVETDMCAVDAVQYLVGCTFGKGNLVHKDYGKNAFTFIRRSDAKAIRLVTRSTGWAAGSPGLAQSAAGPDETPQARDARPLRRAFIHLFVASNVAKT
jgi:formylmethanofuran dehydrogenase subunit E